MTTVSDLGENDYKALVSTSFVILADHYRPSLLNRVNKQAIVVNDYVMPIDAIIILARESRAN